MKKTMCTSRNAALRDLAVALALAVALGLAGCGDDDGGVDPPDARPDAGEPDAPPPPLTLTGFVIDLVQNQTSASAEPRPFAEFADLPDPDGDNPGAYAPLLP